MTKIKSIITALLFACMGSCQTAYASMPYIEAEAGIIRSASITGESFGVRGGVQKKGFDYSLGYNRSEASIESSRLLSNGLTAHTLDASIAKIFQFGLLKLKPSVGLGYTMPQGTGAERLDDDVSFLAGGSAEYIINNNWSIGTSIRGLFFNTKVSRTVYSSHTETLSNGQESEVLDSEYQTDSINLNSAVMTIGLKYSF